jgi:hypothetical protein
MTYLNFFIHNLFNIPILAFVLGILMSMSQLKGNFFSKANPLLITFLLFLIGLKGGSYLIEYVGWHVYFVIGVLVIWALIQPFIGYFFLRRSTGLDKSTAVAVAACFGSVSVMTYVAGTSFLDRLAIDYDGFIVVAVAILEVPAIMSGLLIFKLSKEHTQLSMKRLLIDVIGNKTIVMIVGGMVVGATLYKLQWSLITSTLLIGFKPVLTLFLFNMGWIIGNHRQQLRQFSWSLSLFGCYMPLLGASVALGLSYCLGLDRGTGTLVSLLSASASYIAVPAAMKMALPSAKEAIYLPLCLGITFPFNVVIGIPLYYQMAQFILG